MSRSIHTTYKDLKGKTKKELDDMLTDPDSILHELAKKSALKENVLKKRKQDKTPKK